MKEPMKSPFLDQSLAEYLEDLTTDHTDYIFQFNVQRYGLKEATAMQEEQEYLSEIACKLMAEDTEPQPKQPSDYS